MDLGPYVETLRRRAQAEQAVRVRRAASVRSRLADVVRILVEDFHAERVVLFGSLRGGELHADSDVDLAVWGVSSHDYFAALDRVTQAAGLPVDLVLFEEAVETVRARILEDGELLHG